MWDQESKLSTPVLYIGAAKNYRPLQALVYILRAIANSLPHHSQQQIPAASTSQLSEARYILMQEMAFVPVSNKQTFYQYICMLYNHPHFHNVTIQPKQAILQPLFTLLISAMSQKDNIYVTLLLKLRNSQAQLK